LTANEAKGLITGVAGELLVEGTFDDTQLARLQEAAEACRISRAMKVPVDVPVRQARRDG
jgi:organic hydroperoxide reductase OsmC/OhrA